MWVFAERPDCLDEDILKKLSNEMQHLDFVLSNSSLDWNEDKRIGVIGSCISYSLQDKDLENTLKNIYSETCKDEEYAFLKHRDNVQVSIREWQPLSGLSLCNDTHLHWSITMCLSPSWDCNMGGIGLAVGGVGNVKPNLPQYGMSYFLAGGLPHMVTLISPLAKKPLYELQIESFK